MARIKLKVGANEIEIDSRDFYVDNDTLGEIVQSIYRNMPQGQARAAYDAPAGSEEPSGYGLETLDDAETFEPEFEEPSPISGGEIRAKLRILETAKFFASPRTVTETVERLREYGWAASQLDVSKALAKMASAREMSKDSRDNKMHYSVAKLAA